MLGDAITRLFDLWNQLPELKNNSIYLWSPEIVHTMAVNGGRPSFKPMVETIRDSNNIHVFVGATEHNGVHWMTATLDHKTFLCKEHIMVHLDGRLIRDDTRSKGLNNFDFANWYNTNTYSIGKAIKYLYESKPIAFTDDIDSEIQNGYDCGIIALRKALFFGLYGHNDHTDILLKLGTMRHSRLMFAISLYTSTWGSFSIPQCLDDDDGYNTGPDQSLIISNDSQMATIDVTEDVMDIHNQSPELIEMQKFEVASALATMNLFPNKNLINHDPISNIKTMVRIFSI